MPIALSLDDWNLIWELERQEKLKPYSDFFACISRGDDFCSMFDTDTSRILIYQKEKLNYPAFPVS